MQVYGLDDTVMSVPLQPFLNTNEIAPIAIQVHQAGIQMSNAKLCYLTHLSPLVYAGHDLAVVVPDFFWPDETGSCHWETE